MAICGSECFSVGVGDQADVGEGGRGEMAAGQNGENTRCEAKGRLQIGSADGCIAAVGR